MDELMKRIREITARMEAAKTRMVDMRNKAATAAKADSEAERAKAGNYKASFSTALEEFNTAKADLDEAKAELEVERTLTEAKTLAGSNPQNIAAKDQPGDTGKANITVGSPESDAREKTKNFMQFLKSGAKALSGQAMKSLQPTDPRLGAGPDSEVGSETMVMLPRAIAHKIIGGFNPAPYAAKVMLSTDATAPRRTLAVPTWSRQTSRSRSFRSRSLRRTCSTIAKSCRPPGVPPSGRNSTSRRATTEASRSPGSRPKALTRGRPSPSSRTSRFRRTN